MFRPRTDSARFSSPVLAQHLAHQGGELDFPFPYRLMGKDQAPLQEPFREIPQTQFVPYPPQPHETHDIGRGLQVVEARAGPLIELPLAGPTPKASVA